jgi:hypothetical protein
MNLFRKANEVIKHHNFYFKVESDIIKVKSGTRKYAELVVSNVTNQKPEFVEERSIDANSAISIYSRPEYIGSTPLMLMEAYDTFLAISDIPPLTSELLMSEFVEEINNAEDSREKYAIMIGKLLDTN